MKEVRKTSGNERFTTQLTEVLTPENVKYIGERVAIVALKQYLQYASADEDKRLYKGLLKDIHYSSNPSHTFSDGYDYAQTAICFLCDHYGKTIDDVIGIDKKGKPINIMKACLRTVNNERTRWTRRHTNIDEICESKLVVEFDWDTSDEATDTDFENVEKLAQVLGLTERQKTVLLYRMNGLTYDKIGEILSIGAMTAWDILAKIRKLYIQIFSEPKQRHI